MVLCSVSQQRAAKTSSLPLEATPSQRSPHWPDARRPPKGDGTGGTALQLRLHSAVDKVDSFYSRWHLIFSLTIVVTIIICFLSCSLWCTRHPPATLQCCGLIVAVPIDLSPSVFLFACRAWIFDCTVTCCAHRVRVLLVLQNSFQLPCHLSPAYFQMWKSPFVLIVKLSFFALVCSRRSLVRIGPIRIDRHRIRTGHWGSDVSFWWKRVVVL